MPFYHAIIRPGLLDESARAAFANDVVDVHCGVTGAPRSFVHVMFSEDDRGRLAEGVNAAMVNGTIRVRPQRRAAGRDHQRSCRRRSPVMPVWTSDRCTL